MVMTRFPSITYKNTHGHAALLYDTPEERLDIITQYFQEGLEHNELCVFVTSGSLDESKAEFKKRGFDVSRYIQSGALRIFEMNATYMPNGQFTADYMLANVNNYLEEAKSLGFNGLRTAGEMSWIYDNPDSSAEAKQYEYLVNTLGPEHPEFVGLCLYPVKDHFAKVLHDVSDTHPSFIYEGRPTLNLQYQAAQA